MGEVMAQVIAICGWEKFQHYKDRDPPWVKLYRDLLTSESWVLGTDISRLVQVASILLAARYTNKIPFNWPLLKRVASLDLTVKQFAAAIQHLAATNFLEVKEETLDASSALATCASDIESLYSEAEQRQSRAETDQNRSVRAPRTASATRLPENFILTPERRAIAEAEGADPEREFANFVDHWKAASGAKARKHDWDATWRIWCRRAADFKPRNGTARSEWIPPKTVEQLEAEERLREQRRPS